MTQRTIRQDIARKADLVAPPRPEPIIRDAIDRSFELPTGIYVTTVAAYLGFIAVMAMSFMNPGLVLPLAICGIFIFAAFGVPMLWNRMAPANAQRAMTYPTFLYRGVETATGHLAGTAAAVQVLILPVLIFAWGVAVAVIAALT